MDTMKQRHREPLRTEFRLSPSLLLQAVSNAAAAVANATTPGTPPRKQLSPASSMNSPSFAAHMTGMKQYDRSLECSPMIQTASPLTRVNQPRTAYARQPKSVRNPLFAAERNSANSDDVGDAVEGRDSSRALVDQTTKRTGAGGAMLQGPAKLTFSPTASPTAPMQDIPRQKQGQDQGAAGFCNIFAESSLCETSL